MIGAKTYRGIDYIRVRDLPEDQKDAIRNWLNEDLIIKIQTDSSLLVDCVLYKDYKDWFEKIYTPAVPGDQKNTNTECQRDVKTFRGLAFD